MYSTSEKMNTTKFSVLWAELFRSYIASIITKLAHPSLSPVNRLFDSEMKTDATNKQKIKRGKGYIVAYTR